MSKKLLLFITMCIVACQKNNSTENGLTIKSDSSSLHGELSNQKDSKIFLKDSSYFSIGNDFVTFKDISYRLINLNFSPYFKTTALVKQVRKIKTYRSAPINETINEIEIIPGILDDIQPTIRISKKCDEISLYSHHYETVKNARDEEDYERIELFRYKDDSTAFAKSIGAYWLFKMSSRNTQVDNTNYYITLEREGNSNIILKFLNTNSILQKVVFASSKRQDFKLPIVSIDSKNIYEYDYNAEHSNFCKIFSISPKDSIDIKKYITDTKFKFQFESKNTSESDSINIVIKNGLINDRKDSIQYYTIF